MRLLTCYFKKYGPVYGLLVIMSYLFITALSVLVLLVSMHSVLIVMALGFIALLIVQFVVQSNEVNVALGSFGLLVSIVALILSMLSLSATSIATNPQVSWLEPLLFFMLTGFASGIVAFSVFFKREEVNQVSR